MPAPAAAPPVLLLLLLLATAGFLAQGAPAGPRAAPAAATSAAPEAAAAQAKRAGPSKAPPQRRPPLTPARPPSPPPGQYCAPDQQLCCYPPKASCPACPKEALTRSDLWGCNGEAFDPSGPLLDWSWAGYAAGDTAIPGPEYLVTANVRDFGAVGDGDADDTSAFINAVGGVKFAAVIFVPAGTYKITRPIVFKSNIVLRGAGPGRTVLSFPLTLRQVPFVGENSTAWLTFRGNDVLDRSRPLATVIAGAPKGATTLRVDKAGAVATGQWVRIAPAPGASAALSKLLSGGASTWAPANDTDPSVAPFSFATRVTSVDAASGRIGVERPLPLAVDPSWFACVYVNSTSWRGVQGVEALTVSFPLTAYPGAEASALGHVGIAFSAVQHTWVRDVEVVNADVAVSTAGCAFQTLERVTLRTTGSRGPRGDCACGINVTSSSDVLITGFDLRSRCSEADVMVGYQSQGVALTNGRAADLKLAMPGAAYGTLLSDVDIGAGTRLWAGTTSRDLGGATTLWNVRASAATGSGAAAAVELQRRAATPAPPLLTAVGAGLARGEAGARESAWAAGPPGQTLPRNLQAAQRAARPSSQLDPLALVTINTGSAAAAEGPGYACRPDGSRCCPSSGACPEDVRGVACDEDYEQPSALWGCNGELWQPLGRLPDFSYAGYAAGDAPLPLDAPVTRNLRSDYGARGDGVRDDTSAFIRAFTDPGFTAGVLLLPAGTYLLTTNLTVEKGIVLRGEGTAATTLFLPKSLRDRWGYTTVDGTARGTSSFSHSGALLRFAGRDAGTELQAIPVTRDAPKGSTKLYVESHGATQIGAQFRLLQDGGDRAGLITDLLGGYFPPGRAQAAQNARLCNQLVTIRGLGIDPEPYITLDRPLGYNVSTAWGARLRPFAPTVAGAGVQDLTIAFRWKRYQGHLKEEGFNALAFNELYNSYVSNVRFVNADAAVHCAGCMRCTFQDIIITTDFPRGSADFDFQGHRAFWFASGADNLVQRFDIQGRWYHDITVTSYEQFTVFAEGRGSDLNLDFHRSTPYSNLFTALDHGQGSRVITDSGGNEDYGGVNAGSFNTLWSLAGRLYFMFPNMDRFSDLGPNFNFVGFRTNQALPAGTPGYWFELAPRLFPRNLLPSMRATREARLDAITSAPIMSGRR